MKRLLENGMNIQVFAGETTPVINRIESTNQIISNDISDELTLINSAVSPIMSHILKGGRVSPTNSTTIEWIDNYIRKTDTLLKTKMDDTTGTSVEVLDAEVLVKDAVLSIDEELMLITAVSGATATVTRAYGGSEASTHEANAEVKSIGIFMEEGGELKPSTVKLPVAIENKTGIVYEEFEVTETAKHTYIQGQNGVTAYQLESMKKKEELMGIMENKILNSIMFSQGKARNSDGVKSLIKKHGIVVDADSAELTKDFIDTVAEQIIKAGGGADLLAGKYFIVAPYKQANKIDNFNKDTVRTSQAERITGMNITQVVTTGGVLNVFHANSLASNELLILNLDELEIKELYPIKEEVGAKTSLSDKYFFHGEWTVKMNKCPCQMWVKNLKA